MPQQNKINCHCGEFLLAKNMERHLKSKLHRKRLIEIIVIEHRIENYFT